jgi:neurotrimin
LLSVAPNVTILNEKSVHVLERTHIDIECAIEASPKMVSYWIKEPLGRNFQQSYENPRQNVLQDGEKYNITESFSAHYKISLRMRISNFSESDVGIYTCIASNTMGRANATIRLYGEICDIYIYFLVKM